MTFMTYPLVNILNAIEHGHRNSGFTWIYPLKIVIFHSYVNLTWIQTNLLIFWYQWEHFSWLVVWNMTFMTFHILGIIIPTVFHILQRGRYTTNQNLLYNQGNLNE